MSRFHYTRAAVLAASAAVLAGPTLAQGIDPVARGLAAAAYAKAPPIYVNPVMGTTGSAAANTAMIQAALNKGGHVVIDCNGPFYLGSTLYARSNGRLTVTPASCQPTGISGTETLLANWASSNTNEPWVTTQLNTSGAVGPFSVIWSGSTPAWSNNSGSGTTYTGSTAATPTYVTANGNIYWLTNTSNCLGATTGTGPSGTGTGITDGACSWNYVTTNQASPNNTYETATVYYPGHGLSAGQALWLTPEPDGAAAAAWVTGTAYLATQVKSSSGNLYINNTASCTSGATAPTGTGTVSDGSCSWTYVSAAGPTNYNYFWSGAETGQGAAGGLADSAYFGVFAIYAVNDANWLTVTLWRQPAAAFTGVPMWEKQADQNIAIDGDATWNYNYPTNSAVSGTQADTSSMGTVWAGVQNLSIDGMEVANAQKYAFDLNGTYNAILNRASGSVLGTNSDRIKDYGPSNNLLVENTFGNAGDDIFSVQTEDVPPFNSYTLASGDILGTHVRNLSADQGLAVTVYVNHPYLVTDQIVLEDIHDRNFHAAARSPITIYNGGVVGTPISTLNSLIIKGAQASDSGECLIQTISPSSSGPSTLVNNLYLDNVESQSVQNATVNPGATGCLFQNGAYNFTINTLTMNNVRSQLQSTYGGAGDQVLRTTTSTGVINNAVIRNATFSTYAANNGWVWNNVNTGVINKFTLEDSQLTGLAGIVRLPTVSDVTLSRNLVTSTNTSMQGVTIPAAGSRVHLNSNYFNNLGFGVVRFNGVYATTIFSDGGNQLAGSSTLTGNVGTSNANLVGSVPVNVIDGAVSTVPTINSCNSGGTVAAGSNAVAGSVATPAATTSCVLNLPSQSYSFAPRGCQATDQSSGVGASCSIAWTSATSATMTIAGASIGGTTVNYSVQP